MAASGLRSSARPFLSDRTRLQIVSLLYTQTSLSHLCASSCIRKSNARVGADKSSSARVKEDTRVVPIYMIRPLITRDTPIRQIIGREDFSVVSKRARNETDKTGGIRRHYVTRRFSREKLATFCHELRFPAYVRRIAAKKKKKRGKKMMLAIKQT